MHDVPLPGLRDLVVVMAASLVVVFLLRRGQVPTVLGFLLAGVLIGPGGFGLIRHAEEVEVLAEVGVALLLFTIGLKFSLTELLQMGRIVWGGGSVQVLVTALLIGLTGLSLGLPPVEAFTLGAIGALSSTAIILKLLEEKGATASAHGRLMIGVLLFQDLAIIPMMLAVPLLAGARDATPASLAQTTLTALGMVMAILVLARFIFPWILEKVVGSRSGEMFTFATLLLALGTAWVASLAGVSLALGAFLAGIVLADSDYSHQILGEIAPFRDAFTGLFFVSIGMLVDPSLWLTKGPILLGWTVGVLIIKALVAGGVAMLLGFGPRVAIIAGIGLAQVGEFSFLLGSVGLSEGLLEPRRYQQFIAVTVMLMALSPLLLQIAPALADWAVNRLPFSRRPQDADGELMEEGEASTLLQDHVVVIGFGVNGHNVARVLADLEVPFIIIELNPKLVQQARSEGYAVLWGDAARRAVLERAGAHRARSVVVAIADAAATRQITALVQGMHAETYLVVRTRYLSEIDELVRLGANIVVPEEFETSLELAGAVMRAYGATDLAVAQMQQVLRKERYQLLRESGAVHEHLPSLMQVLSSQEALEFELAAGAWAIGRSLAEMQFRTRTGAAVLAIQRQGHLIANPPGGLALSLGDHLVLLGPPPALLAARSLLLTGKLPATGEVSDVHHLEDPAASSRG